MSNRDGFFKDRYIAEDTTTVWAGVHEGEGPAVVLLHGFPDDSSIYDNVLPLLASREVIAIDFPGYGKSPREGLRWELGTPELALMNVLSKLDIHGAVLVGHDASLPVAINVALDYPERVGRLVLLNGYYDEAPMLRLPDMIRLFGTTALDSLSDAIMAEPREMQWLLNNAGAQFGITADPGGVAQHSIVPQFFGSDGVMPDAKAAIRAWTSTLYPGLQRNDERVASGALRRAEVPVIVAFGENDPFLTPGLAQNIAGHFSNARVQGVAGSSHWPQWDKPEVVASLILYSEA